MNQTPFISLEKDRRLSRDQSKLYDLLLDFDLETCYQNPADEDFEVLRFLAHADELETAWEHSFKSNIQPRIDILKEKHAKFIQIIKLELRNWTPSV